MSREQLIKDFEETYNMCLHDERLKNSVRSSMEGTRLYPQFGMLPIKSEAQKKDQKIEITKETSFACAKRLHNEYPNAKIGVLNFASATNPGGGVTKGSAAQEESLCRCSTLYPTLDQKFLLDQFYNPNREARNNLHTDDIIYSPNVIVFKNNSPFGQATMDIRNWFKVDIISCAAPNLRKNPKNQFNDDNGSAVSISDNELYVIQRKRISRIFEVAKFNGVDIILLGAFGCGAFRNNPYVVANAFKNVIQNKYKESFDIIAFPIFCRDYETGNYDTFNRVFAN